MKENYKITGYFYSINDYNFRKYLHIKKNHSTKKNPDLMAIMMNPGGSRPLEGGADTRKEVKTVPDRTQNQIIEIMERFNFEFTRILNLSDIREPKSKILYQKMAELEDLNISHSIFDSARNADFEELFVPNVPIILAWGVGKELEILAKNALAKIGTKNTIGWQKEGFSYAYYHPLPQNYNKQKEWVERISDFLK